ncbi:hypothetical protein CB1_000174023 [Camelus ferus]|nr:hypothetical protein CB1_000174023 [Camelus ferus]
MTLLEIEEYSVFSLFPHPFPGALCRITCPGRRGCQFHSDSFTTAEEGDLDLANRTSPSFSVTPYMATARKHRPIPGDTAFSILKPSPPDVRLQAHLPPPLS